jgi:hypothetical protein
MKTECTPKQFEFHGLGRRQIVAKFDGGQITSDGGGLLLREVEKKTKILHQLSQQFVDYRDPDAIEHTVEDLVTQRTYGIALGYEDLNDHDRLRHDHLLAAMTGKHDPTGQNRARGRDKGKALASSSTLNRLELTPWHANSNSRYKKITAKMGKIDDLMVDIFLDAHATAPKQIWLDLDATDDPLHGNQEGRFFRVITKATAICHSTFSVVNICCVPGYEKPTRMPVPAVSKSWNVSFPRFDHVGRRWTLLFGVMQDFAVMKL